MKRRIIRLFGLTLLLAVVMVTTAAAGDGTAVAAKVDSTGAVLESFDTLEAALEAAAKGDTVRLEQDVTLDRDLTIPAGVTLVLPCMNSDPGYVHHTHDGQDIWFNHDNVELNGQTGVGAGVENYRLLTVPENVTLSIEGRIMVNAITGRPSAGHYDQDVTGDYAQIDLLGDIEVLDGGNLECFGYIRGEGLITAKDGGTVGDLYIVRNWRGGTLALKMYGAQVYPMNQSDCRNIESDIWIDYGGTYTGLVKMFADGNYYYTRFPQVDVANGLIRLTNEDGYVLRSFVIDPEFTNATDREVYEIYGGAQFAHSSLTILGEDVSSSDFIYPIDGDMDFILNDGEYVFVNDYKFLTGVTMTARGNAAVKVADKALENGDATDGIVSVVLYSEFNDLPNTSTTQYPDLPAATLTLEEGASLLNAGVFAGTVITSGDNVQGEAGAVWKLQTKEANGYATSKPYIVRINHSLIIECEDYEWSYRETETAGQIKWQKKKTVSANKYITKDAETGSITVELEVYNTASEDMICHLYSVFYDENGQMLEINLAEKNLTVKAGEELTYSFTYDENDGVMNKVFLLNEQFCPVMKAK